MQLAVAGQPFDGDQLGAVTHDRQREAGVDALAITQHCAGPALAMVAALLGAYQVQLLTQQVEQRGPGVHLQ
ncbi:hypothetical protein D3C79_849480 [compost metagenome]